MNCRDVDAQLAAYAAGTLSEAEAWRLERHASTCATCEAVLTSTARPAVMVFAPQLPPELRAFTLHAVATDARARRTRSTWLTGVAALAAAAMLAFWLVPRASTVVPNAVDTNVLATNAVDTMMQATVDAGALAAARATSEFDALDAATRELRTALDASPADPELQAFLKSVTAQREQLLRRVRDAKS
jgi:Putative zinc-finger